MDIKRITKSIDHTLLKVDATWEQIKALCDEAYEYQTASVCIPASYVSGAAKYLKDKAAMAMALGDDAHSTPIPVCTVIGFPNGYETTAAKIFQAKDAITNGASEIDMVINVGWVKSGWYDLVLEEIEAIRTVTKGHILKVIIETCLLTEEEKIKMCEVVTQSGADFIKTSTGFSTHGATPEDVRLLKEHVGPDVRVKAAGGIHTLEEAQQYLDLGASRLGTSSIIAVLKEQNLK